MKLPPHAIAAIILSLSLCASAVASPASEAVGVCLSDSTTGKDRKDLARWIFLAMAAHPEIKDLANVTPASSEESSRKVAALLTRLIVESCPAQIQQLVRAEGPESLRTAFEFLGKVAIQELTTNEAVNKTIQDFQRYVDRSRLEPVLAPR